MIKKLAKPNSLFSIDSKIVNKICNSKSIYTMNALCAYLILANGTGKDQQTTAWSANSVSDYAEIGFTKAQQAIQFLIDQKIIQKGGTARRPRYKLTKPKEGSEIWLPQSIVMPITDNSTTPIVKLRKIQNVELVRFFLMLYQYQNLEEYGGMPLVYRPHERVDLFRSGHLQMYAFIGEKATREPNHPFFIEYFDSTNSDQSDQKEINENFWDMFVQIEKMNLLEYSVYLFEGSSIQSEWMYPIYGELTNELKMMHCISKVILARSKEWAFDKYQENYDIFAIEPAHLNQVSAFGVYRMRHRAHTSITHNWIERIEKAVERFEKEYSLPEIL